MEIAWEERLCGPKRCKGRKQMLLSSKHKWQHWKYLFSCITSRFRWIIHRIPNSKAENISTRPNPHSRVGDICLPQARISKLKNHFTNDHTSKLEVFVFSTNPNSEVWSIWLSIRPRLLKLVVPQNPDFNVSFSSPQISRMETWFVCSKHTFQSSTYLLPVQGPSFKS